MPGLSETLYSTDDFHYHSWSPEDLAILPVVRTQIVPDGNISQTDGIKERILCLRGFVDVPQSGVYSFSGSAAKGATAPFTLYDSTGNFVEATANLSEYGGGTPDILLEKGQHPVTVIVTEGPVGKKLTLQWKEPGIPSGPIPATAICHAPESR